MPLSFGPREEWTAVTERWSDPQLRQHYLHEATYSDLLEMFQFTRDLGIESLSRVVDKQLWSVAPDFHALCRLNCMFLRGQLEFTPYHSGSLLVESVPLVPALLELHEYGVFTYESNPYELALVAEDMSVEHEQRPYLNCVLSASHSAAWLDFFEALKSVGSLVVEAHTLSLNSVVSLAESENVDGVPHFRFRAVGQGWSDHQPYNALVDQWQWDPRQEPLFERQSVLKVDPVALRIIARQWGPFDLLGTIA